MNLKRAA